MMDHNTEERKGQSNDYSKVETSDISEEVTKDEEGAVVVNTGVSDVVSDVVSADGGVGVGDESGLRHRNTEDKHPSEEYFDPEEPNEESTVGVSGGLRGILRKAADGPDENRSGPQLGRGFERSKKSKNLIQIGNLKVKEHFSLAHPSSAVAFAEDETLVFVDNLEQVTLEKKSGTDYLTAKQATFSTPGLFLTRAAYTMVALLMAGFIFAFCIQILLFLFLGLAINGGK
jgi:hypothetical protein